MRDSMAKSRRDTELHLEAFLDCLPDCLVVLDEQKTIRYFNAAWERAFGSDLLSASGFLVGASYPLCYEAMFHPDEAQKTAFVVGLSAVLRGESDRFDFQYPYRGVGQQYWFAVTITPCPIGDKLGALIQQRDITGQKATEDALRQGEERFRQMAENIREVFWMTDPRKNTMIYVSPAYEEIWGRTCESLYARPISFVEAIHEEDRERIFAALAKQVEGTYDEEYRVVRPDGSARWIRDRAFPIRDAAGEIYRVVGIAEDITERKAAEEALHRSAMQEEIIRAQAEVLAELSTPLFPVSDHVVVMPLIGTLDPQRTQRVIEALLHGVQEYRAHVAIIDITGVPVVDTQVADGLVRAAQALRLLGAQVIITGIRPEVAQTLVGLGVNLSSIVTQSSLQSGITYALEERMDSSYRTLQELN